VNIPRQMINLLGIVVVVALLVAGLTMVVLPMYSSARAIDTDTANVAQTNQLYDVRVSQLTAAQAEIETLTGDVTALRRQISASSQLDDVMQIVVDSARATGATIESVSAADAEPWAPRTGLEGDDDAGAAPADDPAEGEATPAEGDTTETGGATTDPPADAGAGETSTETEPAVSPQQQIAVTITVEVPDARSAAAFIDALSRGPRLLATIDGTLEEGVLTVTALALVRTED
jgi:TolA-binding protein